MKKGEMMPLTNEENIFYDEQESCNVHEKSLVPTKMMKIIKIKRLRIPVITQESLEELPLANATLVMKFQKIFQ